MKFFVTLLICYALLACGVRQEPTASNSSVAPQRDERVRRLSETKTSLERFFQPMTVTDGDWLESHPENGETFEEYIDSGPTLPGAERNKIYVQPLGNFTAEQMKVVRLTSDYLRSFYNLPVVLRDVEVAKKISSMFRSRS